MSDNAGGLLRPMQQLFGAGTAAGLTERQLLQRYVVSRDDLAFETLVGRHGRMVWGVCRRVLDNPSDAEDAFQATFLVLARRASALQSSESLGPWLHGVALRVARRARSQTLRRRCRERQGLDLEPDPAAVEDDPVRSELSALIDAECRRLPARYADPIVLCLLEGLSHEEAARQLGCPLNTLKGRLARGRKQLQSRLIRRGLAPTAVLLYQALGQQADAAVLERLVSATVQAARGFTDRAMAIIGPNSAISLAEGVLRMMIFRRIKITAAGILAAGLFTAVAVALVPKATGGDRPDRQPEKKPLAIAQANANRRSNEPLTSYPVTISPKQVYELPALNLTHGRLRLKAGPVSAVPLTCEPGMTGLMILGNGTYSYEPAGEKPATGTFRAALLRFNPKDEASLVALGAGKKVTDHGAYAMTRHLTNAVFGHCWHRGNEALIPPPGNLAVVLYSREHGDLLISGDGQKTVTHSFTENRDPFGSE